MERRLFSRTSKFISIGLLFVLIFSIRFVGRPSTREADRPSASNVEPHILLLYVYAATHSHAYGNLKYFIENTVQENDGVDYYFILQKIDNKEIELDKLPRLTSSNAHYVQHENKCFDFGTFGWFFDEFSFGHPWKRQSKSAKSKVDLRRYKYFILMNSSVRGPYFPPYYVDILSDRVRYNLYWYSAFTNRIDENVKMVGCTISCETVPHVQSYFVVVDFVALKLLMKPGTDGGTSTDGIFHCYPTKDHVSIYSELPSSNRILNAGYRIDSMMTEYQKWNFTSNLHRFCNENNNPYKDKHYHGASLEPYEVVFVKFNDLEFLAEPRRRAQAYQNWTETNRKRTTQSLNSS